MRRHFADNTGADPRHSKLAAVFCFAVSPFLDRTVITSITVHSKTRNNGHVTLNQIADIQAAAVSSLGEGVLGDATVFSSVRFLGETMTALPARGTSADDLRSQKREQKAIKGTYPTRGKGKRLPALAPLKPLATLSNRF
jgi:hypothetical protein